MKMKKITGSGLRPAHGIWPVGLCNKADSASGASAKETKTEASAQAIKHDGKVLVVYYSASGHTKNVASYIATATKGERPGTAAGSASIAKLIWTIIMIRAAYPRNTRNESLRNVPLVKDKVDNWSSYDTVFIGYPIWWGIAAWPVDTFVKANDFTGKTVIPFATSYSSGLGVKAVSSCRKWQARATGWKANGSRRGHRSRMYRIG